MDGAYTHSDFLRLVVAEFPELSAELEDDEGLLHLQMHTFARLAQHAKGEGDWDTYARCMRLAAELWRRPDDRLLNALNVSFLEHLDFDGRRGPEAWKHLSPELQDGWRSMQAYNERLVASVFPARKRTRAKPHRKR